MFIVYMPQKTLAQAARAEDSRLMCFCKFVFFFLGVDAAPSAFGKSEPCPFLRQPFPLNIQHAPLAPK